MHLIEPAHAECMCHWPNRKILMCGLVIFHIASRQLASISVWLENYHLPPPPPEMFGEASINKSGSKIIHASVIHYKRLHFLHSDRCRSKTFSLYYEWDLI